MQHDREHGHPDPQGGYERTDANVGSVFKAGLWVLGVMIVTALLLPGIVLATGMLWAYLTLPGLWIFYGSLWILLIAYIIKGLPLGVRALSGTIVQVHQELEDCARVHGASWLRTLWSIVLRLIRPGIMAGGIFFVYIAIRDLSTPILLYGYGTEVLSIVLLQFWAEKRPQVVSVLAILMLVVLTIFSALQRFLLVEKEQPETIDAAIPGKPITYGSSQSH